MSLFIPTTLKFIRPLSGNIGIPTIHATGHPYGTIRGVIGIPTIPATAEAALVSASVGDGTTVAGMSA